MGNTRECHTLTDLRDLLKDFNVLFTPKGNEIVVTWPDDEEHDAPIGDPWFSWYMLDQTPNPPKTTEEMFAPGIDPIYWKRLTRATIRTLVSSGRFWRLTTTAHHLCCFFHFQNHGFGIVKTIKKRDEDFRIVFENEGLVSECLTALGAVNPRP